MIVDTSVIAAILLDEPDARIFETLLIEAESAPRISTASVIELGGEAAEGLEGRGTG